MAAIGKILNMKSRTGQKEPEQRAHLPLLVKVVLALTTFACLGNSVFEEFKPAAIAWIIPFIFAASVIFRRPGHIRFPYYIWLPWALMLVVYLIMSEAPNALQRTVMMICPFVVGMAVSTCSISEENFLAFEKACRLMTVIFLIGAMFKTGLLITDTLPQVTGLAAEVMTSSLLCCVFAANYSLGRAKDLVWWSALAILPVIAVTRMGILATGVSLPFTFAPLNFAKRLIFIIVIAVAGLYVFTTERVQQKMFYGGSGTIQDVRLENPDFATSGRTFMWRALEYEINKEPWFGHGANAVEPFLRKIQGQNALTHPHNDWLRLQYDYGYVGMLLFVFTMLGQIFHAWKLGRVSTGNTRVFFYVGASSFLIFSLFMFTDNIILYAAFFGNLQFTILGLAYAAHKKQQDQPLAGEKIRAAVK
jgi:O-antigen ligase